MANSETQKRAIRLGEELVREFSRDPPADRLTQWISYYIAQQIAIAEASNSSEKAAAEGRCFDAVLALWQHRNRFPARYQPFNGFAPILETLERLNPDSPRPFYLRAIRDAAKSPPAKLNDVERALKFAEAVDRAARALVTMALQSAAEKADDAQTQAYLRNELPVPNPEIDVVRALLRQPRDQSPAKTTDKRIARQQQVAANLARLDYLLSASRTVRKSLVRHLAKLGGSSGKKGKSSTIRRAAASRSSR